MLKEIRIFVLVLMIAVLGFISRTTIRQKSHYMWNFFISSYSELATMDNTDEMLSSFSANTVLREGNGILFMETTDRMDPPSLVLCAIESAARVYPDRPVVFFMKGLEDIITKEDEKRARQQFPTLSSLGNVYLFPLRMDQLFNNTPLKPWFDKVNPNKEVYWTHVSSDACRLAMMWKYGGIYMDADVISLRPIPKDNFLAAESLSSTSSSVFGLSPHHQLTREFMKNFVENYRGRKWGYQGPKLITRVIKKLCGTPVFKTMDDVICKNINYFHRQRFSPIFYSGWRRYFAVWKDVPAFKDSYALHLWNYMNKEGKSMVPGSNTLVEHLYQKYCPTTYGCILRNESTHL
ncbi:alpha-1,4-N-acetylglucosaminyltransferase-like [Mantella aurantiaca]